MSSTLEYHNFSLKGDPRWSEASRFSRYAPLVVLTLCMLSIAQVSIGAVWVVQLQSSMTIPKILQTLILPGLAFFNTLPSLHLHMLSRRNPPKLAIWFSSSLCGLFLTSSILYLVSCKSGTRISVGLRRTECAQGTVGVPVGPSATIWDVVVAFSMVSTILYGVHAAMAVVVHRSLKEKKRTGSLDSVDPAAVDPDLAQKARDRWRALGRYELA